MRGLIGVCCSCCYCWACSLSLTLCSLIYVASAAWPAVSHWQQSHALLSYERSCVHSRFFELSRLDFGSLYARCTYTGWRADLAACDPRRRTRIDEWACGRVYVYVDGYMQESESECSSERAGYRCTCMHVCARGCSAGGGVGAVVVLELGANGRHVGESRGASVLWCTLMQLCTCVSRVLAGPRRGNALSLCACHTLASLFFCLLRILSLFFRFFSLRIVELAMKLM